MNKIRESLELNPIIAAVEDPSDIDDAICSGASVIFLIHADIFNLKDIVDKVKASGKTVLIHIDFLEGLGKDNKAIDYIAQVIKPDGIISTRTNQIKYAMEIGLFCIQRFFLIDSISYETMIKTVKNMKPDMIEIMPALMTGIIRKLTSQISVPVIAGGLIESKSDIIDILNAGAIGVSTGKKALWSA